MSDTQVGLLIFILVAVGWLYELVIEPRLLVKPGQVYEEREFDKNPFKQSRIRQYRIIDNKKGYVKYMDMEDGVLNSCGTAFFLIGKKRVKNKEAEVDEQD